MYNFRSGILRKLRAAGHELWVIAPPDKHSQKLIDEGFNYLPVTIDIYNTHPIKEFRTLAGLYRIYRKIRPDLVFHYTIKPNVYGTLAAACLNIPSVGIATGLGIIANRNGTLAEWASRNLYRLAVKFVREIWFLNPSDRDLFLQMVNVPGYKVRVIPGEGIDTGRFVPAETHCKDGRFRFLYAGRLVWSKGFRELEKAAEIIRQRYPEVIIQLLGFIEQQNPDGIPEEQIKAWQQAGLFEYAGATEDVLPWLHQADCAILPSYREGLSRILLEAASSGLPAIATEVPGCREVIGHGVTGLLCNPYNAADLAERMEQMIQLPEEERHMMGINARQKVIREYEEKIVLEEYLAAIGRILAG